VIAGRRRFASAATRGILRGIFTDGVAEFVEKTGVVLVEAVHLLVYLVVARKAKGDKVLDSVGATGTLRDKMVHLSTPLTLAMSFFNLLAAALTLPIIAH
jgi:hypothetical protein